MPYKATVLEFLDNVDKTAAAIGAVNTIKREGSILTGYNTDVIGFQQSLIGTGLLRQIEHKALILGSGGAAKAVEFVLNQLGFSVAIVSRTRGDIRYEDIDGKVLDAVGLVVNTTPLGMNPNAALYPPLPYEYFSERHLAFDLIYNPEKTVFLEKAAQHGASIINGFEMLELQAEASWKIWNS